MKKRWILFAVASVLLFGIVGVCTIERPIEVATVTLEPRRVEQTISCMGVVETADVTAIQLPVNCRFSRVNVKAGDRVQKGDVLAVIDKEATRGLTSDGVALMTLAAMSEEIVADKDGTVVEVKATTHQVLEKATPCVVLSSDDALQIRIAIREKDLSQLEKGMAVRVTGDGFAKASYTGELAYISSAARQDESGTIVEGRVTLAEVDLDPSLRIGLTAKAAIVTAVNEHGYLVPYEAVLSDESGFYVYVVESGKAQKRSVTVAKQVAQGVLLGDDVLAGMEIVYDATLVKEDGQRVSSRESGT